ncbi:hypothetical protein JOC95_003624 [Bacillus tianshenii]|uniref:Lipoprotein n=1 Tax=Sutcliffiella tianshenii TaxID=1463404 RepID=A0ABS2P417_9BACI|nr:hypothetical protein [Bacillus tianshenii]MBM7621716.1 hypothetical protein [Bacillus tianshenii]
MKLLLVILTCFTLVFLTGCKEEKRKEPEVNSLVNEMATEVSKMSIQAKEPLSMTIHHHIKGQHVYMECIVGPDFHFTDEKSKRKQGEGRLGVYVDGKLLETVSKGAFILKGIPSGTHTITVKLMHNDQTEYGLSESFVVEIN